MAIILLYIYNINGLDIGTLINCISRLPKLAFWLDLMQLAI